MINKLIIAVAALGLAACQADAPPAEIAADEIAATESSPADAMNDIADRYYIWTLDRLPEQAYFAAIDLERHDGIFDNSPGALAQANPAYCQTAEPPGETTFDGGQYQPWNPRSAPS